MDIEILSDAGEDGAAPPATASAAAATASAAAAPAAADDPFLQGMEDLSLAGKAAADAGASAGARIAPLPLDAALGPGSDNLLHLGSGELGSADTVMAAALDELAEIPLLEGEGDDGSSNVPSATAMDAFTEQMARSDAYRELGNAEFGKGNHSTAGEMYTSSIVALDLARAYAEEAADFEDAKGPTRADVVRELDETEARVLSNRSLVRSKTGDLDGALQDASRARDLFPTWAKAYYRLGQCLVMLSKSTVQPPSLARHADDLTAEQFLEAAKAVFDAGANLPLSEHCTEKERGQLKSKSNSTEARLKLLAIEQRNQDEQRQRERQSRPLPGAPRAGGGPRPPPGPPPRALVTEPQQQEYPPRMYNDTGLLQCAVKDKVEQCRARLRAGADPDSCNRMGQTALHVAAIWGSMRVGRLLLEHGASVNITNKMGRTTPLMSAAQRNQTEFAKMLLQHGANPKLRNERGMLAHQYASDPECRELLGGPSGRLCKAVKEGDMAKVQELAGRHPELLQAMDSDGNTPLTVALAEGHWDIAMYFARHPAAIGYVNEYGADGNYPLHIAAREEKPELLDALLIAGADADLKSMRMNEYTRGNYERVSVASSSGKPQGQKEVVSAEHRTPLFECAENGNLVIAKLLTARRGGCDIDATDGDGCTALYVALDEDEDDVAEFLLSLGASPDIGNADIGNDNTLLAWAASRRRLDHVELLLEHGADPNKPGKSGMYPLHMAARAAGPKVLACLLAKGADPTVTTTAGDTPRQVAEKNKRAVKAGCDKVLAAAEEKARAAAAAAATVGGTSGQGGAPAATAAEKDNLNVGSEQ